MGLVSKDILRFNTPTICGQYVISAYGNIWIDSYYVLAFLQNKDLFATVELTSEDKYLIAMPRKIQSKRWWSVSNGSGKIFESEIKIHNTLCLARYWEDFECML